MTTTSEYLDTLITRFAREKVQAALARKGAELVGLHVEEVSAVDHPANRRPFLVIKRDEGTPTDVPPVTSGILWDTMVLLAKDEKKRDKKLTLEQAIVRVQERQPALLAAYETLVARDGPEFGTRPAE